MTLNWLLALIPVALVLDGLEANPLYVFLASALAIVPLAKLMADATEVLALALGPTLGGLLNASLGNVPEIIIGLFALHKGLVTIVKASITGSIIGNLLFGLGLAMFAGGLKFRSAQQDFDTSVARISGAQLTLAAFGLRLIMESGRLGHESGQEGFEQALPPPASVVDELKEA